jgi:hypothetical protein
MTDEEKDEIANFLSEQLSEWEAQISEDHSPSCPAYHDEAPQQVCECGQRPMLMQIWAQYRLLNQWAALSGAASAPWFPANDGVVGQLNGEFIAIQILAEAWNQHPDYQASWRFNDG